MSLIRRSAALTAGVAVAVLAVGGATPASAATAPTHRQVVSALLTAEQLPDGWHRTSGKGSAPSTVTGCDPGRTRGLVESADRSFGYRRQAVGLDESVSSYRTLRYARLDVRRGIRALTRCDSLTVDGHAWTVNRLKMPTIADQQAMFELSGFVSTPGGDVPVTSWLGVTRMGHHVVSTMLTAGGAVRDEDLTAVRGASRWLLAKAMRKAANKLGL